MWCIVVNCGVCMHVCLYRVCVEASGDGGVVYHVGCSEADPVGHQVFLCNHQPALQTGHHVPPMGTLLGVDVISQGKATLLA